MVKKISPLEKVRKQYKPKLPMCLRNGIHEVIIEKGDATESMGDHDLIKKAFPHTYGLPIIKFVPGSAPAEKKPLNVGVVLSGGQAPGGHNAICGIYDAIVEVNPSSKLFGFLGGPSGLEDGKFEILDELKIDEYRNTGGFDMIGSGRTKLETKEQFEKCLRVIKQHNIDAVVIIGGDDSNTNAAMLGEFLLSKKQNTPVIGIPKTIDGDLRNAHVPISFGFDTATKTFSELVGNICRDSSSAKKYWHFVKLMGRTASHIALEVGLQTQANVILISEEVESKGLDIGDVVETICHSIVARADEGKNYGVVIIPEGLIEFMACMKSLISNLNHMMAEHEVEIEVIHGHEARVEKLSEWLEKKDADTLLGLPREIQAQLIYERDPHGNVQVSKIATELLLIELVEKRLKELKQDGKYQGKFSVQNHFFGYEGRCAPPSNFDADYTYSLGYGAVVLIQAGATGYMSAIKNLSHGVDKWVAGGIPITMMLNMEHRHGKQKAVIKKACVELDQPPFQKLQHNREEWAINDNYIFPGPIQYFGPDEICDAVSQTLILENK
ncbi:diphosphate--fructose-6-phosphate 1-phosphotransferase [Fibrobacterota bacterium]